MAKIPLDYDNNMHKHCQNDSELFNRDGKSVPSRNKYVSDKNLQKDIKLVINSVGFIFK